jgi:hypothetical protein
MWLTTTPWQHAAPMCHASPSWQRMIFARKNKKGEELRKKKKCHAYPQFFSFVLFAFFSLLVSLYRYRGGGQINDIVNIRQEARCQGGFEGRNTQFEA